MKKNKNILNEKFNKTEISSLKRLIKKELKSLKKKELESFIKREIEMHVKKLSIEDINDKEFDKYVSEIFRELMQKYHDMFYRQKDIMKSKFKI